MSSLPGGGSLQRRAAQLRTEAERKAEQASGLQPGATVEKGHWRPVQDGETLEGIAAATGRSAGEIWAHPSNKQLTERRKDPSELAGGDALYIPEKGAAVYEGTGPVGQGEREVQEGECIASIAKGTGHFWETIWKDPANSELRQVRKSPNVLLPGDLVTIPAKRKKQESGETEMRHRFQLKGEPTKVKLRFTDFDKPRAGAPYELYVDGKLKRADVLDADGYLEVQVPADARKAEVLVYDEYGEADAYDILLRRIPPITEVSGLQARLANLGYPCGRNAREFAPIVARALEVFQRDHGLTITGLPDEATRAEILEMHGC